MKDPRKRIMAVSDGEFELYYYTPEGVGHKKTLLEVVLRDKSSFLKIAETLTRIGIANVEQRELFQSVHILHKSGRYFLVHFKEMFALDGRAVDLGEDDLERLSYVAGLLQNWGLLTIKDFHVSKQCRELVDRGSRTKVFVLSHRDKPTWTLRAKYRIGKRKTARAESR